MTNASSTPRVALATAMTKNAAYAAEWLHYQLSLDFSQIIILLNRSDDLTRRIIESVARHYPSIKIVAVDYMDRGEPYSCTDIQQRSYDVAIEMIRNQNLADYVALFDADEYWMSSRFQETPAQYLARHGRPDIASFHWVTPSSDDRLFDIWIDSTVRAYHYIHVKSIINVSLNVTKHTVHNVFAEENATRHVAAGISLHSGLNALETFPSALGDACLIHRLFRSPVEYLATLGAKRPSKGHEPFKSNRFGYRVYGSPRFTPQTPETEFAFSMPVEQVRNFREGLEKFICQCGLEDMIIEGRRGLIEQARATLTRYTSLSPEERQTWALPFTNLDLGVMPDLLDEAEKTLTSLGFSPPPPKMET